MASILQPLNVQLPAQAFAQSASAIGAYEQLRGIRDKRQQEAQDRQKKVLIAQLTGRTMMGDQQAAQQLAMVAPDALQGVHKHIQAQLKGEADIQSTQAQTQLRQAELPQVQQASADVQRRESNRQTQVLRAALNRIKQDPQSYESISSALVNNGIVPAGVLPESNPTPEQIAEIEAGVELSEELTRDPIKKEQLTGQLGLIDAGYDINTEEGKDAARRLLEADVAVKQAQAQRQRTDNQINGVNIPRGLYLLNKDQSPTQQEVKEARTIVGGIAPVLDTIGVLRKLVQSTGAEILPTVEAARAQGLAATIQLQLKDAFELGALDAGSERFLRKLFPGDPTQWRVDKTMAAIDDAERNLMSRMRIQAGLRNMGVDVRTVVGTSGNAKTSSGGIALDTRQRTALLESLKSQGMSDANAARTMDSILKGEKPAVISSQGIMPERAPAPQGTPDGQAAQPAAQQPVRPAAPTQDERAEAELLLDRGVSVADVRRRIMEKRRAARPGQSAPRPQTRQQLKQMEPARAAREALRNPKLLTPEERKEIIRKGIEGKGWLDVAADVLGIGNGQ